MFWVIIAILAMIVGLLEDLAPFILILIVVGVVYIVFDTVKSKVSDISKNNLSNKKALVINELKIQLENKQDILNRFEEYYCKKQRAFNLVTLIFKCDNNNSQTLIDAFNHSELDTFESLKANITPILTEDEKKNFPRTINDFAKYKIKLDKEIVQIKERISSIVSADKTSLNKIIESYCPSLSKKLRKKKIKMSLSVLTCVIIVLSIIITSSYIKNTPYRELRAKIDNQTLTAEMVEWGNRDSENSYYEYLHSEKGCRFLADLFSKLHKNNEIEKAMWLLCIQPHYIDGFNLCASDSFIDWVVNYAKENGTKKEQSDGDITYYVNGYEVSTSSRFDYSSVYISNGTESTSVEKRNPYREGTIPTIK